MIYTKTSCGLVTAAFVLTIIAITLPVFSVKRTSPLFPTLTVQTKVSLWETCDMSLQQGSNSENCTALDLKGSDSNVALGVPCDPLGARFEAARAMDVLTCIVLGILFLLSFARTAFTYSDNHKIHLVNLVFISLGTFFALLAFPVVLSIYTSDFSCELGKGAKTVGAGKVDATFNVKETKNTGPGMNGIMMSLVFGSMLAALVLEVYDRAVRRGGGNEGLGGGKDATEDYTNVA